MGIEDFVVGVVYLGAIHPLAFYLHILLVARIHQFLIVTGFHQDDGRLFAKVGDEVERALQGIEIAIPLAVHHQCVGSLRSLCLGSESPSVSLGDTGEGVVGQTDYPVVDGHIILFAILQHVVVGINDRG